MAVFQTATQMIQSGEPEKKTEGENLLKKFPNYAEGAYDAFMNAKEVDSRGTFVDGNKPMYMVLWQALYMKALAQYSELQDYDGALSSVNKSIKIADELGQDQLTYNSYAMRGFINVNKEAYDNAITDFNKALELYAKVRPNLQQEDPNIAKVYENLIFIYSEHKDDSEKALKAISDAKSNFRITKPSATWNCKCIRATPTCTARASKSLKRLLLTTPTMLSS